MKRAQYGIGLPEMLVACALGLILSLATAALLHAASLAFLHNGSATRLDDSGRFALAVMGMALRQAGYAGEPGQAAGAAPPAVSGRDAAGVAANAEGLGAPLPAINGSDVLAVRYAPSVLGAAGALLNCAGFPAAPGVWAWSIFYVAAADDGEAELRCKYQGGAGWGSDAVVRGVDAFHVLYGIDTDTPRDGLPNRYLTASALDALDAAQPAGSASLWRRVCSVRVALLLHGDAGSRPGIAPQGYALLPGADPGAWLDEARLPPLQRHRVRRLFAATVALRNGE